MSKSRTWALSRAALTGVGVAAMVAMAMTAGSGAAFAAQADASLQATPAPPAEPMAPRYLEGVPELAVAAAATTSTIVGIDAPTSPSLTGLSLRRCVELALDNNLGLINARRDLDLSESSLREAEAFFIPFADLVGDARYQESRTQLPAGTTVFGQTVEGGRTRVTRNTQEGRLEVGNNLPTGGNVSLAAGQTRTRAQVGSGPDNGTVRYDTNVSLRATQPLLRGAGWDVGTASLRSSRLSRMNSEIAYQLRVRGVVESVIQQYFAVLQAAQDLRVSRDALTERLRFLEETRIKFEKGRVAESAISRAEFLYLQEKETWIRRQQSFNDRVERMALTLGFRPGTAISLQDITADLARRGRVRVPPLDEAIEIGLNNRLEMLQLDISLEQARIGLDLAKNNLLPNLDATAGYSTFDTDKESGGATDLEDNLWDVGLAARVPLVNIARRESYRRSRISLEQTKTSVEERERGIIQEIKSAHRAVETTESGLTILEKSVEQARRNLKLANDQYEVGFVTVTDVRLAQDDLFQTETQFNNTLLNYQVAIAQLYTALGQPLY